MCCEWEGVCVVSVRMCVCCECESVCVVSGRVCVL